MRTHSQCIVLGAVAVVLAFGLTMANAQGVPGVDPNTCLAGKTKCVNEKVAGLLKCRENCQKNPAKCGGAQTACEDKVKTKFDGGTKGVAKSCFGKLEAKSGKGNPKKDCTTTGDLAAMEAKVDACVADVVAELEGIAGPTLTPTPVRTPTPVITATPGGGGQANVSFTVNASAEQVQAFKVEVGYPTAKGSFTGSADTTACTTDDADIFLPNDNDSGTLILVASQVEGALVFPVVINCAFDQAGGQTLAAGDLTPDVVEVSDTDGNPLDPGTISVDPAVS